MLGSEYSAVSPVGCSDKRSRHLKGSARNPVRKGGYEKDGKTQTDSQRTIERSSRGNPEQAHSPTTAAGPKAQSGMAWETNQKVPPAKERPLVSGDGVISVRMPLSLLGAFRATAELQALTIHQAARGLIAALHSLTLDQLKELEEPPPEVKTPRISLYVGWRLVDVLVAATRDSGLTNSTIFRRLLYGLLVTKEIVFVQQNEQWKLQIASQNNKVNRGNCGFQEVKKQPPCA